jgi:hypothetical protein
MIDPLNRVERDLKTAEEFFELAKAGSPFLKAYCRCVAERYLSSQGELKSLKKERAIARALRFPAVARAGS